MPQPKIKRVERRQAKAEYKTLTKPVPSGDASYDKFREERQNKRDELAGGAKMRGNSERMTSKTAAYCGKDGCSSNAIMSGDGNNSSVISGTKTQVRGGRSFQESGKGTLRSELKKQKKADIAALALASRKDASEYDLNRAEAVKSRLGLQAASRERKNQEAFYKKKKSNSTL